jgi:hypothetical protein
MDSWDRSEEGRVDRGIAVVARQFDAGADRAAVAVFLTRVMYGRPWRWVATRCAIDEGRAEALARRGRRLLDRAIDRGALREPALALALGLAGGGCGPEHRSDPAGPIRAARDRRRPRHGHDR